MRGPRPSASGVLALVREKYSGPVEVRFGPTLAAEHLASEDGVTVHHDTLAALDAGRGPVESGAQAVALSAAAGAQGAFRRARAAGWQFPPWFEARAPRGCLMNLVDDATGRTLARLRGAGNDLGGGRCVAPVDRGVRRAAGALYGLEKRLCAGAECGGTGHGRRAADAVWPDVRGVGDSDHRRRVRRKPRDASSAITGRIRIAW